MNTVPGMPQATTQTTEKKSRSHGLERDLRRNMSIDRLHRGHFRIKDSNEDYEELKKHLELVRRAGQDYPYFDWDD